MKKQFFLCLAFLMAFPLLACENPLEKIMGNTERETAEPERIYEHVDVLAMSPEELKAFLEAGGHETHVEQLKLEYRAEYPEIGESEETAPAEQVMFDDKTPWEKGIQYIDEDEFFKDATADFTEEESEDSFSVPESYRKYLPEGIKDAFCQSIPGMDMIYADCTENAAKEIISRLIEDGFAPALETADNGMICFRGEKEGLFCQVLWSEGSCSMIFTREQIFPE